MSTDDRFIVCNLSDEHPSSCLDTPILLFLLERAVNYSSAPYPSGVPTAGHLVLAPSYRKSILIGSSLSYTFGDELRCTIMADQTLFMRARAKKTCQRNWSVEEMLASALGGRGLAF